MQDNSYWFALFNGQVVVTKCGDNYSIPYCKEPPIATKQSHIHIIGEINNTICKGYEISDSNDIDLNPNLEMIGLRESYNHLKLEEYYTAGKAAQIIHWDQNSQFCPRCGVKCEQISPIAKKCPICNQEIYPRISTATIVLIRRGNEILLVHARSYRGTQKGLVAGFLEVGETLESCVEREVFEETGLKIKNLKYFGNQPWPYPSGLMIGFTADYESGDINLQEEELTTGEFYAIDNLPELPPKLSIARQMIDAWIEEMK